MTNPGPALVDVHAHLLTDAYVEAAVGSERLVYGNDYCFTPAPAVRVHAAGLAAPGPTGSWRALLAAGGAALLGG